MTCGQPNGLSIRLIHRKQPVPEGEIHKSTGQHRVYEVRMSGWGSPFELCMQLSGLDV